MKRTLATLATPLLLVLSSTMAGLVDVYQMGRYTTTTMDISSVTTIGLDENLSVSVPMEPGTYPMFYLLTSLAGITPGFMYSEVISRIASHGVVVVFVWKRKAPLNPEEKVVLYASMLEWSETHLEDYLHSHGVPQEVSIDFENIFSGGHSAGAHILVEYLKGGCGKHKGMVLLDPVDGIDPMGIFPIYSITLGEILNFAIPTYHLSAGLDSVPGPSGYACAPEEMSNERFWTALDFSQPGWSINATEYGHLDFMDLEYIHGRDNVSEVCYFNEKLTDDDYTTYRSFVSGQIVAFLKALIEDDCTPYLAVLEDTSTMIVDATERHVNPTGGCPRPYCSWIPLPTTSIPVEE